MGAEQSQSSNSQRAKISKDEVDRLLAQQRLLYEQKYAELSRIWTAQQMNNAAAQQNARDEARKEVESIMKEKHEQLLRQNAQLHNTTPKCPENPKPPSADDLEKDRSSYSCSGAALTNTVLDPKAPVPVQKAATPPLYPNVNNAAYTGADDLERDRSSYSCSGAALTNTVLDTKAPVPVQKAATPSLYPNVNNAAYTGQVNATLPPRHSPDLSGAQSTMSNKSIPPLMANYPSGSRQQGCQENIDDSFVFVNQVRPPTKLNYPTGILIPLPRAPTDHPARRARSASRTRNKNPQENEELNCPTCKNRYHGNIYQCSRGHSSCQNCKFSNRNCGALMKQNEPCCLPITEMRNITLEAYICERKVHCPNSAEGCCLYMKLADLESHVKECPFREMECPLRKIFGQCTWTGKLSQVASHFDKVHQIHRQGNIDTEMILLNLNSNNHIVYLVVMGTYNFLFHAKVSERDEMLYMAVTLLGTHQSAAKWSYEIHIYNKREPRRKYQYADICRSANTSLEQLSNNAQCAAIPFVYASTFISDGCLTYKFYIKKDNTNDSRNNFGNKLRGRGGARRRV